MEFGRTKLSSEYNKEVKMCTNENEAIFEEGRRGVDWNNNEVKSHIIDIEGTAEEKALALSQRYYNAEMTLLNNFNTFEKHDSMPEWMVQLIDNINSLLTPDIVEQPTDDTSGDDTDVTVEVDNNDLGEPAAQISACEEDLPEEPADHLIDIVLIYVLIIIIWCLVYLVLHLFL